MIDEFKKAGIVIDEGQANQLKTLMEFMLEYNKNVNLVANNKTVINSKKGLQLRVPSAIMCLAIV